MGPVLASRTGVGRGPLVLLEGRPGVGKTTVVRRLAALLRDLGLPLAGFTTEEIREGGRRLGFRVEDLRGRGAILAHTDLPGPPRVGRYGVDLSAFERIALPAIRDVPPGGVVIVDELGKMELGSASFRAAFLAVSEGRAPLVATVHAFPHAFTDRLKSRPDAELVRVTEATRDELPAELASRLVRRSA